MSMIQSHSIGVGILDEEKMCVVSLSDSRYKKIPEKKLSSRSRQNDIDLLGSEKSLLDPEMERQGVLELIQLLSEDEKQEVPDSHMYIRHLRREKGNVKIALKKLREVLRWRREFGVRDLLAALPRSSTREPQNEDLAKILRQQNADGKVYVRGFDREGRAFLYLFPAREQSRDELNILRHIVWNLEKAIACTAKKSMELNGVALEKFNVVIDYAGFRPKHISSMSLTKDFLEIMQKHYTGRLNRVYAIHPPGIFLAFWRIIRPFVDHETRKTLVFCIDENGIQQFTDAIGPYMHKVEKGCGESATREFDSAEYLSLPFDVTFDE